MSRAPYRSQVREASADRTRRAVLEAARALFAERGYAETTVAGIADRAGVAVPTVYASAGGKRELLVSLCREAASGDHAERALAEIAGAPGGRAVIDGIAAGARSLNERYSGILEVAAEARSVPEAQASWQQGLAATHEICGAAARRLAELDALRSGLDAPAAATTLGVLVHPGTFRTLVGTLGHSWDDAERWLREGLARLLLAD